MIGPLNITLEAFTWNIPLAAGGELKRDSIFYFPKLLVTLHCLGLVIICCFWEFNC